MPSFRTSRLRFRETLSFGSSRRRTIGSGRGALRSGEGIEEDKGPLRARPVSAGHDRSDGKEIMTNRNAARLVLTAGCISLLLFSGTAGATGAATGADDTAEAISEGDSFRDCAECPEMVAVPAGSFRMGSPESDPHRTFFEVPPHTVTVGEPFAIGKYEVTVGEFGRFASETGRPGSCRTKEDGQWEERSHRGWHDPGFGQDESHPVVCVSWEDAQAYVRWLSRKTGKTYRLPSESEWEYAARAGSTTVRFWGDGWDDQCLFANGTDGTGPTIIPGPFCDDGFARTSPVGSFAANGFGLHDAIGNAWEWTQDCHNWGYAGAPDDGSAWESGDCAARVIRGGAWSNDPVNLRSASRTGNRPDLRAVIIGFRVARTLAQ